MSFFSLNWSINRESLIKIIADSFCGNYKADSKWPNATRMEDGASQGQPKRKPEIPVLTRESRRNSRKTTWSQRLRKIGPLPATASQGKSHVPKPVLVKTTFPIIKEERCEKDTYNWKGLAQKIIYQLISFSSCLAPVFSDYSPEI